MALAHGMSDKEIAQHLSIRHQTVRTHMVNLLGEQGIESRLKALVFAIKHGWYVWSWGAPWRRCSRNRRK